MKAASHIRSVILCTIIFTIIIVPITYNYLSVYEIREVTLYDLRVELITDRKTYFLNETIKAIVYLCNDNPYPVNIKQILTYYSTGYSVIDQNKISSIISVTPVEDWITIPAKSNIKFHQQMFTPRFVGEFFIHILGASVTVNIQEI